MGCGAIGKTADEKPWRFGRPSATWRTLEHSLLRQRVICDRVMAEISKRTTLITSSLGSGSGADIIYLFQNDICGEQPESPRHARAFGDLHRLQEQIRAQRRAALAAFHQAANSGDYPAFAETAAIADDEFEKFSAELGMIDGT